MTPKQTGIMFKSDFYLMLPGIGNGTKDMTRRIIKPQPTLSEAGYNSVWIWKGNEWHAPNGLSGLPGKGMLARCPYGGPGDLLYLKEAHAIFRPAMPEIKQTLPLFEYTRWSLDGPGSIGDGYEIVYRADIPDSDAPRYHWRSPLFMPKWAARVWWELVSVRAERIQDITNADAKREGVAYRFEMKADPKSDRWGDHQNASGQGGCRIGLKHRWDEINAKRGYSWDKNPWVWVPEIREAQKP